MLSYLPQLTEDEIASRLANSDLSAVDSPFPPGFLHGMPRPAAVLIPLLKENDIWHVLFIRRTAHAQDPHGGQVAFPGGASDPGDASSTETALRETHEEIGIHPSHVRLLGRLIDFVTITSYRVTPFVGVIPWPYPLTLEANEVSRAFTIPLDWLADPSNHEERFRPLPPPFRPIHVIYFKSYDGEILWGASAMFTLEFINILSRSTSSHLDK